MPTNTPPVMIVNLSPELCFNKSISMITTDELTSQPINEGYQVGSPQFTGGFGPAIGLTGGKKWVVPLATGTASGTPYLKFHLPQGQTGQNQNKVFITFAVKNTKMQDGYYDYKTGIPDTFKQKLRLWILGGTNYNVLVQTNGIRSREIRLTFYGSSTNKPAQAETVKIKFSSYFTANNIASGGNTGVQIFGPQGAGSSPSYMSNPADQGPAGFDPGTSPAVSDIRMKKNITKIGTSSSGLSIYKFRYIDSLENKGFYQGVIAQDLLDTKFESAVKLLSNGYYGVDYSKLDVEFKRLTDI